MELHDYVDFDWVDRYYAERQEEFFEFVHSCDLDNGWAVVAHRTETIERIMTSFYDAVMQDGDFMFLATGGFGRKEMGASSDVDVHVVTRRIDESNTPDLIEYSNMLELMFEQFPFLHGRAIVNGYDDFAAIDYTQFSTLMDSRLLRGNNDEFQTMRSKLKNEVHELEFLLEKEAEIVRYRKANPEKILDYRSFNLKYGSGGLREFQIGVTYDAIFDYIPLTSIYGRLDPGLIEGVGFLHKVRSWNALRGNGDLFLYNDVKKMIATFGDEALSRFLDYRKAINRFVNNKRTRVFEDGIDLGNGIVYGRNGLGIVDGAVSTETVTELASHAIRTGLPIEDRTRVNVQVQRIENKHKGFPQLFRIDGHLSQTLEDLWDMEVLDVYVSGFRKLETALFGKGHPREGRSKAYQSIRRLFNLEHILEIKEFARVYDGIGSSAKQGLKLALFLKGIPYVMEKTTEEYLDRFNESYPEVSKRVIDTTQFLMTHKDYLYANAQQHDYSRKKRVNKFTKGMTVEQLDALMLFTYADLGYDLQEFFPEEEWAAVKILYTLSRNALLGKKGSVRFSHYLDAEGNRILALLPPELRLTRSLEELNHYAKHMQKAIRKKRDQVLVLPTVKPNVHKIQIFAHDRKGLFLSITQSLLEYGVDIRQAYVYSIEVPEPMALDIITIGGAKDLDALRKVVSKALHTEPYEEDYYPRCIDGITVKQIDSMYRMSVSGRAREGVLYYMSHLISIALEGNIRSVKAYSSRKGTLDEYYFFESSMSLNEVVEKATKALGRNVKVLL